MDRNILWELFCDTGEPLLWLLWHREQPEPPDIRVKTPPKREQPASES